MSVDRLGTKFINREGLMRAMDEDTGELSPVLVDNRGFLLVSAQSPNTDAVVKTVTTSASSITDAEKTLTLITGIPDGAVIVLEESGSDIASLNPFDLLGSLLVVVGGTTAKLIGAITAPITFWFAS